MSETYPIDGSRDALWMATAVKTPATQSLNEHISSDVTIVGGGLTGLNAALVLARNGASVCVLEAKSIGFGASGRSGGQVNLGLNLGPKALLQKFGTAQGERLIDLVINTPDEVFKSIRENQLNCDPVQNGWIQGAKTQSHLNTQQQLLNEYAEFGCTLELLDKATLENRAGTTRYLGGLHCPMAGSLHPLSYTCLLYTSPSPRDGLLSRMPSSA